MVLPIETWLNATQSEIPFTGRGCYAHIQSVTLTGIHQNCSDLSCLIACFAWVVPELVLVSLV